MRTLTFFSALIAILSCLSPLGAQEALADGGGHASLSGGRYAMTMQNRACDDDDLTRLQDMDDLKSFIDNGYLVRVTDTDDYYLDGPGSLDTQHASRYRYARSWTKSFLDRELASLHAKYGVQAKVTSLVRTQWYQDRICGSGNRAATCGDDWWEISAHLTGAAVDVSKQGMGRKAKAWFRKRLLALERAGKVDVIEEAGAFHILVRKAYAPKTKVRKAKSRRTSKRKARH